MEIKVGFEIVHAAVQPTPMVIMLSIHPSRRKDIIGAEVITSEPNVPIGFYNDSFGNICGWCAIPACPTRWRRMRSNCRSINCPTMSCSI
jgi:hypothetical protein